MPDLLRLGDVSLESSPDLPRLYLYLGTIYHVIEFSTAQLSIRNKPRIVSRSVRKSNKQVSTINLCHGTPSTTFTRTTHIPLNSLVYRVCYEKKE